MINVNQNRGPSADKNEEVYSVFPYLMTSVFNIANSGATNLNWDVIKMAAFLKPPVSCFFLSIDP